MRLTSLPLSLALFAASLVLIGVSYKLLIDNGLMEPSPEFAAATLLVCAGTVLFWLRAVGLPVEAGTADQAAVPARA